MALDPSSTSSSFECSDTTGQVLQETVTPSTPEDTMTLDNSSVYSSPDMREGRQIIPNQDDRADLRDIDKHQANSTQITALQILIEQSDTYLSYACHHCDDLFLLVMSYDRHLEEDHGERPPILPILSCYMCSLCGKHARSRDCLRVHVEASHYPNAVVTSAKDTRTTMATLTKGKYGQLKELCKVPGCGKRTPYPHDMQAHNIMKHGGCWWKKCEASLGRAEYKFDWGTV